MSDIAKAPRILAEFDSASAMVRLLAASLRGEDAWLVPAGRLRRGLARSVTRLPLALRTSLYSWSGWAEASSRRRLSRARLEDVWQWVVESYPGDRFPALFIGSSNGAVLHLCAAMGAPWLPQTVLVPVRDHSGPGDPAPALDSLRGIARALVESNPEIVLYHMHDPNQDRLMLEHMAYFRVKLRSLPRAYTEFVRSRLAPGGTIFVIDCTARWPVTRVGERCLFQLGAHGGSGYEDYRRGGAVERYLRARKKVDGWDPPASDEERPEAEWGFDEHILDALRAFARREGFRLCRIRFEEPEDPSEWVAGLYRLWYESRGIVPEELLVESFILMAPRWVLDNGAIPYWTKFSVESSLERLDRFLQESPGTKRARVLLFSHGVDSVGYAPIQRWRALLRRLPAGASFVGVDEDAYPRDFGVFGRYLDELTARGGGNNEFESLDLGALQTFAGEIQAPAVELVWD